MLFGMSSTSIFNHWENANALANASNVDVNGFLIRFRSLAHFDDQVKTFAAKNGTIQFGWSTK